MAVLISLRGSCVWAHTLRTKLSDFDTQHMASKAEKYNWTFEAFWAPLSSSKVSPVFTAVRMKASVHSWAVLFLPL